MNIRVQDGLESDEVHGNKKQNQGVEGPSQIRSILVRSMCWSPAFELINSVCRYAHYLEAVLYSQIDPTATSDMYLQEIQFLVGNVQANKPWCV